MDKPDLSLCMIVKGTEEEAKLLDRCLSYVHKYVDELCITISGGSGADSVRAVAERYKARISDFVWCYDFSAARNYNFSQALGRWILWLDADDVIKGAEKLRETIKTADKAFVDALILDYLYAWDENKNCTVKHKKTQIIRNDGSFTWVGKLHEDLIPNRNIKAAFVSDIQRLHLKSETAVKEASERNVEIAEKALKGDKDPRNYWNYAATLYMCGRYKEAIPVLEKFIKKSGSEEEIFIAHHRLAASFIKDEKIDKAIEHEQIAIRLRPWYPDPYFGLGHIHFQLRKFKHAKEFFLTGLSKVHKSPHEMEMIVWNPREYDYYPLMSLAHTYYELNQPKDALLIFEKMLNMFPKDKSIKYFHERFSLIVKELEAAETFLKRTKGKSDDYFLRQYDKLSEDMKRHPAIWSARNQRFIRTESSGKDLAIYCTETAEVWSPENEKTGIGGSEEAVINVSRELAKLGWNVTVYATTHSKEAVYEGVSWKPFWQFNYRDKWDVVIAWRLPTLFNQKINATKTYVWLHDVISKYEFTPERLKNITKIIPLSKWHRNLFPNVPDDKIMISANGINQELFNQQVERQPYKCINTSAPDRGLEDLLKLWPEIKKQVPQATLYWYYGWKVFYNTWKDNPEKMRWMKKIEKLLKQDGVIDGGRVGHEEIAKEYLSSNLWLYPTEFTEISCITAMKAQLAGCIPITTNVAALNETVQHGVKIPVDDIYTNKGAQEVFVSEVVKHLTNDINRKPMMEWAKSKFSWTKVARQWHEEFK